MSGKSANPEGKRKGSARRIATSEWRLVKRERMVKAEWVKRERVMERKMAGEGVGGGGASSFQREKMEKLP